MEGRDIGSMVFPDTLYKFYIDASLEVRAQRRAVQGQRDDLFFREPGRFLKTCLSIDDRRGCARDR